MLNPFHEINWRPDRRERRRFARSLVIGFPCLAAVLLVLQRGPGGAWHFASALALGGTGTAIGSLLWIWPGLARPFYFAWYGVACALGFAVGNLLLVAVYFLLLTPTALALRAGGRRMLTKTIDRQAATYWCDAPPPPDVTRSYRQF